LDLKQIKLIIDLMKRSDLTEFAVEEEGFKLKICRSNTGQPIVSGLQGLSTPPFVPGETSVAAPAPVAAQAAPAAPAAAAEEANITYVKSPMVGTFYRAPTPDAKPFAEIGTKVVDNTPVCIIEAMKIMNEIQSEVKGTIIEVLAENGQPIEYGQKLFKVRQG